MMKLTPHTNRYLARLLMGLVLFAQGVVCANVYAAPDAAPAPAVLAMAEQDAMQSMGCHEEQAPGADACTTHCSLADQVNVGDAVQLAAPVSVACFKMAAPSVRHISPAVRRQLVVVDTGPPLSIRFCSFLI